jgi:hypothetical protein
MQYVVAVGIPLVLIGSGALAKKLVRGSAWIASDFFLGVQLALAAMGSSLIFVSELARVADTQMVQSKLLVAGLFIAACFFLLFLVMAVHQDWEKRPQDSKGQMLWLGGLCNLIGVALLAGFVLFVKGTN